MYTYNTICNVYIYIYTLYPQRSINYPRYHNVMGRSPYLPHLSCISSARADGQLGLELFDPDRGALVMFRAPFEFTKKGGSKYFYRFRL